MSGFAAQFIPGLVHATVALAASAAFIMAVVGLLRLTSPTWQRLACAMVLVQGVLFVRLPLQVPWHGRTAVDPPPKEAGLLRETRPFGPDSPASAPGLRQAASAPRRWDWSSVAVTIWLAGMGILLAAPLFAFVRSLTHLSAARPADAEWAREWDRVLGSRSVRRTIPLRVAANFGPMLCRLPAGYQVIVPEGLWAELSPSQRAAILRHELAHYERGDIWKSLAMRLLALPHWFNPFAWWAVRRFDECAEWACDRAAAGEAGADAADFAKALMRIGTVERSRPSWGAALRGQSLFVRIRRLLAVGTRGDSMMKKIALLGGSALLVVAGMVRIDLVAQEPAKDEPRVPSVRRGANHLVFQVETELQRLLIRPRDAKIFVALNGTGIRDEDDVDEAALEAIRRDLVRVGPKGEAVQFSIFFGEGSGGFNPLRMKEALSQLAADLGLQADANKVEWRSDVVAWKEIVAQVEDLPAQPGVEEAGLGDRRSKAYPVRTHLSRYLTGGADCVVILTPLDGNKEEVREAIRTCVSQLKIARRKKIGFRIIVAAPDGKEARNWDMEELDHLAKSLGFEKYSLTVGGQ